MYSPMSAYDFINNSILGTLLLNTIGDTEYYKLLNYFKVPKVKLDAYEEISVKFNEIFEISSLSPLEVVIDDIKRKNAATMNLTYSMDINEVLSTIPEELLNIKGTTKETKEQLLISSNKVSGIIPEINGYSPTEVICNNENASLSYDQDTRRFVIERNSIVNDNGKLVTNIGRSNGYNLKITYPKDLKIFKKTIHSYFFE